jgi:hypothetical protein
MLGNPIILKKSIFDLLYLFEYESCKWDCTEKGHSINGLIMNMLIIITYHVVYDMYLKTNFHFLTFFNFLLWIWTITFEKHKISFWLQRVYNSIYYSYLDTKSYTDSIPFDETRFMRIMQNLNLLSFFIFHFHFSYFFWISFLNHIVSAMSLTIEIENFMANLNLLSVW